MKSPESLRDDELSLYVETYAVNEAGKQIHPQLNLPRRSDCIYHDLSILLHCCLLHF